MAFLMSAVAEHFGNPGGLWEILILGLFKFIVNYGWRIVFFTVCLKLLLLPLDLYQRIKMRKNQIITERLKPQIEKLQQQYAGDQRTLSQKQMELNRKEGFSYFSSCLPAIVTLVIFFYLFAGLNNISHFRIFDQYVELYDAYAAEEILQKDIGRSGIFNTEEIDALLFDANACKEYFAAKAPEADDYKTSGGEWYESDSVYERLDDGGNVTEKYTGGQADYMRAQDEYRKAVDNLNATANKIGEKKADGATVSWNELNAWRLSIAATEPKASDYKIKFGDKKGEWAENGEADYKAAAAEWENKFLKASVNLLDKTAALHKDYVLEPSQDAAVERYGAVQEDFLWISNIWSPDVPWRDAILDYNNFVSNISDYSNFDEVVDELDAKVDGEFNRTVFESMMSEVTYNNVTGKLRASDKYNVVNGFLILPILSVGLSFLSQFITARLQKKSGQAAPTGGMAGSMKFMMFFMPVMMGIFALTYTAMFTLYIVVNSATTILINLFTTLAMNGGGKLKEKKNKTSDGIQKYGRPDPKDL